MTRAVGRSVRRIEDRRLLTGRGKYAADFRLPGMLHGAVLRSPHAHARLHAIRAKAALGSPGVVAVVTAEDLGDVGRIPVRLGPRPSIVACLQPPLARDKVRYVGDLVAAVAEPNANPNGRRRAVASAMGPTPRLMPWEPAAHNVTALPTAAMSPVATSSAPSRSSATPASRWRHVGSRRPTTPERAC